MEELRTLLGEDWVLVLALWSLGSHFSLLTSSVPRAWLIQQLPLEATVRIFSEATIMLRHLGSIDE